MALNVKRLPVTTGPYVKVHWERKDIALQATVGTKGLTYCLSAGGLQNKDDKVCPPEQICVGHTS